MEGTSFRDSGEVGELAAALSAAQGVIRDAPKNSKNPHFKSDYANLESVLDAVRGPFSANGLSVVQMPCGFGDGIGLLTRVMHKSGQWMESVMPMGVSLNQPQPIGSWITYARRYALMAVAGVAPTDDDGNEAQAHADKYQPPEPRRAPAPSPAKAPTRSTAEFMRAAANHAKMTEDTFLKCVVDAEVQSGHADQGFRDVEQMQATVVGLDRHDGKAFRARVGQLAQEIRAEAEAVPEEALAN